MILRLAFRLMEPFSFLDMIRLTAHSQYCVQELLTQLPDEFIPQVTATLHVFSVNEVLQGIAEDGLRWDTVTTVSYTHLDVYKRQVDTFFLFWQSLKTFFQVIL